MRSKKFVIPLILFLLFSLTTAVFTLFGVQLRDFFSPKVTYMNPVECTVKMGDEDWMMSSAPNSLVLYDDSGTPFVWIIDEDEITGEKRNCAKKLSLDIYDITDDYTITLNLRNKHMLLVSSDREIIDNQRVVVTKMVSAETED
jgi:hypothetical protein